MVLNRAQDAYRKTNVATADTASLVLMCYEATIEDLRKAKEYHASHRMDAAYERIRHGQDVITELLVGLDFERGGEIAVNLSRIYNYLLRELIGINSMKSPDVYNGLIDILEDLREAWQEVKRKYDRGELVFDPLETRDNWARSISA
ncbi:flagellar protein FliS [Desulfacinum infernum DSM 9756]|jgi:flagellar protein FliS|uniref:Flagellar secretion chaperone FliS n=1 Tax=Desulfacinum infernum DSM 9756 TaxID=1121391 RepID=A0A1M5CU54_9BACT|nr:flagellar export chaperone FliS [Desulfacinum infernum]SHF58186.1 flagellar protein FliS [Desulfacinum infernum DSM 9756]